MLNPLRTFSSSQILSPTCTHVHTRTHPPIDRVGGGEDAAARVQLGVDPGLSDGDATLLHHLRDTRRRET